MRLPMWLGLGLVGMVAVAAAQVVPTGADRRTAGGVGELLVVPGASSDGYQQLVVIDSAARKMAVYQIARSGERSGEIALKSVRNIGWDLKLDQFNGTRPTPDEIRAMLPAQFQASP